MAKTVAFLRGINVGGHRKIKMAELTKLHEGMGHQSVVTYLQSGNVVFECSITDRSELVEAIEWEYGDKLGLDIHVILRSAPEMEDTIAKCPFPLNDRREAKFLHGVFLAKAPVPAAINVLMQYEGPEEIQLIGDVLYVYYTEGSGRSKFNLALIEKSLGLRGTARNWNSISKILELMKN